jgi:hypothetical protein
MNTMYDWEAGEGFIFATGAPGSRWSGLCRLLALAEEVDNSDESPDRRFWNHFGNYFGPGMEHGNSFDRLADLGKDEILAELARPFSQPADHKVRLLKSHFFARHLDFIRETMPMARILLVYRTNEECLSWWLEIGGFSIPYPDYSWYQDVDGMRNGIAEENAAILDFASRMSLQFVTLHDPLAAFPLLGLTFDRRKADVYASTMGMSWDQYSLERKRFTPTKQLAAFRP